LKAAERWARWLAAKQKRRKGAFWKRSSFSVRQDQAWEESFEEGKEGGEGEEWEDELEAEGGEGSGLSVGLKPVYVHFCLF
jgi:hypothetical protein